MFKLKSEYLQLYIFTIGVLLSCTLSSRYLLDNTLLSRFVFLAFFILIHLFNSISKTQQVNLKTIWPELFLIAFGVYTIGSILIAINKSLAITESSKILLLIIFYFSWVLTLKKHQLLAKKLMLYITIILLTITIIFIARDVISLESISKKSFYSITGLNSHKNLLSSFTYLLACITLYGYFNVFKTFRKVLFIALVLEFTILLLLQTRAVWIGTIVFGVSFFGLKFISKNLHLRRQPPKLVLIVTSIILINLFFTLGLPKVIELYKNKYINGSSKIIITNQNTLTERVLIWDKTYEVIKEDPFFGVGANNWKINNLKHSFPKIYKIQDLNIIFQRPHNDFIWKFSEYGFLGFNLFLVFIISILIYATSHFFSTKSNAMLALLSGLIGYGCISFFDFPSERIEHNLFFILLLGLLTNELKNSKNDSPIKGINLPNNFKFTPLMVSIMAFCIAFLNFKGEVYVKTMLSERKKQNHNAVINIAEESQSFCYSLDPNSIPVTWYSGNAKVSLGNISGALSDFEKAIEQHPFQPHVLNDYASIQYSIGNIEIAKANYKKAIKINPRFDDPKLNLTAIYINEENYKEASFWVESIFHDSERRTYYRNIIATYFNKK